MKKIIILTLLLVSFAGSAFATTLAGNTPSTQAISIFGGIDTATAQAAANPLIKLSSKVTGIVNYTSSGTPATSTSYAIGTKHHDGTKIFGTASDSTTIFWKLSIAGTDILATDGSAGATGFGSGTGNVNFSTAGGKWTAY